MINYTTLASCFSGLVGFRASQNADIQTLDSALTGSTSSVYVTDVPGITPEVMQYAKSNDYATLSAYLTAIQTQETIAAVKDYVKNHKELTNSRAYYDNVAVTQELQYLEDQRITKAGRFVGIYFKVTEENIVGVLKRVGCQFNTLQNGLRLYLYESSQSAAIKTYDLTNTKTDALQWFDLTDFIVYYRSLTGGTAQHFYLGYYESDLAGQAVDTKMYGDCGGCGLSYPQGINDYIEVSGFEFGSAALNGTGTPDLRQVGYTEQTFGLHVKMSVQCDITEHLCDQKLLFDNLIKHRIAKRIFWDYYNTTRVSRQADIGRNNALANIEREEELYKAELKGISLDFSNIDRYCLKCNRKFLGVQTLS